MPPVILDTQIPTTKLLAPAKTVAKAAMKPASKIEVPKYSYKKLDKNEKWVDCSDGARRWGLEGAGGVLLTCFKNDRRRYMLAQRSASVDQGYTWGVPCGAVDENETISGAVKRELKEECDIDLGTIRYKRLLGIKVDTPCPEWSFTTLLVDVGQLLIGRGSSEVIGMGWFTREEALALTLHPAVEDTLESMIDMVEAVEHQKDQARRNYYETVDELRKPT